MNIRAPAENARSYPEFGAFIYPPRIGPESVPWTIDRACMRVAIAMPKPPNRRGFNLRGLGRLKSKRLRIALRGPAVDIQKSTLFWVQSFFRAWFGMFIASAPLDSRPSIRAPRFSFVLAWGLLRRPCTCRAKQIC